MKKKEILARLRNSFLGGLIVFVFAVILSAVNLYFYKTKGFFSSITSLIEALSWKLLNIPCFRIEGSGMMCAISYKPSFIDHLCFGLLDLLFWFLAIFAVWIVVKWIKRKK